MTVLVAGGGITGLAAAHALLRGGADVILVESAPRLGGKVASERVGDLLVERGPDSFLAHQPTLGALCREIGLGNEIVAPLEPGGTWIWHRGDLVPLPEGFGLGPPTRVLPFLRSRLFSPLEKARAALEVLVPADRSASDVTIGAFLRRRFGGAVVERLAGPLVSAVYGASADELSLDALLPRLRGAERRHGSLVRAGLASRGQRPSGPPLLSLRRGMGSLVEALEERLRRADVRCGVGLRRLERAGTRYAAHLGDGSRLEAEAIVLATPAPAAARALEDLAPGAAAALGTITYRGTAVVSLAYDDRRVGRPPRGHGFVAADGELAVVACSYTSAKWPSRSPEGTTLVRASVRSAALLAAGAAAVAEAAHAAVAHVLRIHGPPLAVHTAMWPDAMPRYTVDHLERLARIDAALRTFPGLILAGAAYRGSGLPDCVAQGQTAAEKLLHGDAAWIHAPLVPA